ncbi:hypothetical protein KW785_03565 [Candidatus Parcubacteria bacterium]|nr:hypothetical protein [Candidatus Parcubacteria bacterium]
MNEWSIKRKRIILGLVLLALIILLGIPFLLYFHQTPTCSDGKRNGDETGVDCGGSCQLLCPLEASPLIVKGDPQVLYVATSTFDIIAYMQNPNINGEVALAPYTINIYDDTSSGPLRTISGKTFIPKNSTFAIFQGPFDFGSSTPTRATFSWGNLIWKKNKSEVPELIVKDVLLTNADTKPRIDASVYNTTLQKVSNIELVALIFDENGTIVHASRTVVDTLGPNEVATLVYTWPSAFVGTTTAIEIVPRTFPDASLIK